MCDGAASSSRRTLEADSEDPQTRWEGIREAWLARRPAKPVTTAARDRHLKIAKRAGYLCDKLDSTGDSEVIVTDPAVDGARTAKELIEVMLRKLARGQRLPFGDPIQLPWLVSVSLLSDIYTTDEC
jgi:hypothetical protein